MSKTAKIVWLAIIALLIYCLCACFPFKKLQRLQKNHSYLFELKMDTIHHYDTINVVVPGVYVDTFIKIEELRQIDTFIIEKDNLKAKLWLNGDLLLGKFGCDTVFVATPYYVEIPYNKFEIPPVPDDPWWILILQNVWIWYALFWVIIIFILYKYLKKS